MKTIVEVVNKDSYYFGCKGNIEEHFPENTIDINELFLISFLKPKGSVTKGMFKKSDIAFIDIE